MSTIRLIKAKSFNEVIIGSIFVFILGSVTFYRLIEKHLIPGYFKRKLEKGKNAIIAKYFVLIIGLSLMTIMFSLSLNEEISPFYKGAISFLKIFFLAGIGLLSVMIYIERNK